MRQHKKDLVIIITTVGLLLFGLMVIFGIGPRVAETNGAKDIYVHVKHHLIFVAAAILIMVIFSLDWQNIMAHFGKKVDKNYVILTKKIGIITLATFVLCATVPVIGWLGGGDIIVSGQGGAYRRFIVPFVGEFQPVELLKLCLLFYVPSFIKKRKDEGLLGDWQKFWVPILIVLGATLVVIAGMQKDLGSTVVILTMILIMLLVSGVPFWQFGSLVLAILLALGISIITQPHRMQRIAGWNSNGEDYHLENSLIGIGTGGIAGVGLGDSVQTAGYLPEAMTDSIFSVICESFGFIGAIGVLVVFGILLLRLIYVARRTEDLAQRLTVIGVFAWILAHVIMNVGGMIGIIPMKGITLSFLSYGGTSLVFTGIAIGVVLQISGWTRREIVDEDTSSRRGQRGTRYAGYRRRS